MTDPEMHRVSDEERHQVAEILRVAAGDGRIDLEELDQRLEATYAARTYADLAPITFDLPSRPPECSSALAPVVAGDSRPARHLAILSRVGRTGSWTVPEEMTVTAVMGGADLDLRQATFSGAEAVLTFNVFMGSATVIVGPSTTVVLEGTGIMGGFSGPSGLVEAAPDIDGPSVRIRGVAIWGGVCVERKPGGTSVDRRHRQP